MVTIVALNFGALLGGAVVTETSSRSTAWASTSSPSSMPATPIPSWRSLMVTAVFVIIFNLLADLAYGFLDPRVRLIEHPHPTT